MSIKIKGMDRTNCRRLVDAFTYHMNEFNVEGVEHSHGRVTVDERNGEVSFKLTLRVPNADGSVALNKEARAYEDHRHEHLELSAHELGHRFQWKRTVYELSGFAPRSWKRPVLAVNTNTGATFKFSVAMMDRVDWLS